MCVQLYLKFRVNVGKIHNLSLVRRQMLVMFFLILKFDRKVVSVSFSGVLFNSL